MSKYDVYIKKVFVTSVEAVGEYEAGELAFRNWRSAGPDDWVLEVVVEKEIKGGEVC